VGTIDIPERRSTISRIDGSVGAKPFCGYIVVFGRIIEVAGQITFDYGAIVIYIIYLVQQNPWSVGCFGLINPIHKITDVSFPLEFEFHAVSDDFKADRRVGRKGFHYDIVQITCPYSRRRVESHMTRNSGWNLQCGGKLGRSGGYCYGFLAIDYRIGALIRHALNCHGTRIPRGRQIRLEIDSSMPGSQRGQYYIRDQRLLSQRIASVI
jgi:hypothetical protein